MTRTPNTGKLSVFLLLFLVGTAPAGPQYASAGEDQYGVEIFPLGISQGDPFLVRVYGSGSLVPEASFNGASLPFIGCGESCFMALGATTTDMHPGRYRVDLKVGGKTMKRTVMVKKAAFGTMKLRLPEETVSLSPEALERAEEEEKRLKELWEIRSERLWEGSFILPSDNEVSTSFGTKRIINKRKVSVHKGIDIRGKDGEPVKASNRGRVVFENELFFGGRTIVLDHGFGLFSVYMHLSGFAAGQGEVVSKGDVVGYIGSSGRSSGPHLHFGIKVGPTSVNPLSFTKLPL